MDELRAQESMRDWLARAEQQAGIGRGLPRSSATYREALEAVKRAANGMHAQAGVPCWCARTHRKTMDGIYY